jgi:DNA-binding CsgD family transcriptional regulator
MPSRAALTGTNDQRLFLEVLDTLGAGLAFFSCEGALLHGTSPLGRMLAQQPDGPVLQREVQRFAHELCTMVEPSRLRGRAGVESLSERRVPTESGMYRLRGSYVGAHLFEVPGTILVALDPPMQDPLSTAVLRGRWKLSARQAMVAQLLAGGRTNDEISITLGVSPHTVRRHTEQVMRKVGARTRAAVTSILLRG